MSPKTLLTNHLALIATLVIIFLLPPVLNSVFGFLPISQTVFVSYYLLFVGQILWLLAIAIELDVLSLGRHRKLLLTAASAVFIFVGVVVCSNLDSQTINRFDYWIDYLQWAALCAAMALSALISERISKNSLEAFLIFWAVLQWPIFLFLVAPRLRRALNEAIW